MTLSLLLDTVVGWRQLELISARSCVLTLWIIGSDAHATYAGAEAAPTGSPLRALRENADVLFNYHGPIGERSGPHPRLAVEGRSDGHGPMLPCISDVTYISPCALLPHWGGAMAAGPVSRLGSLEPGDKTGLRLSPT